MKRLALVCFAAAAALAQVPSEPPKVLRIIRQAIKPGKAAAHEKAATGVARAAARFLYPAYLLALSAASGEPETWTLEWHDSFASIENADAFIEKTPALKWWLGQYEAQNGDPVANERRLLAAYRQDLSYRGEQFAQNLSKMRYVSVVLVRLHPARDADFADSVRLVLNAYQKSNNEQPLVVYQVVSGAQGPSYLFFSPMVTLKTMDDAPLRGRAIREAMGEEDAAKMLRTSAEVTAASESFLFAVNPRLSYVSKDLAAADPDFWIPKPPPAPKAPTQPGTAPGASPAPPPVPHQ